MCCFLESRRRPCAAEDYSSLEMIGGSLKNCTSSKHTRSVKEMSKAKSPSSS